MTLSKSKNRSAGSIMRAPDSSSYCICDSDVIMSKKGDTAVIDIVFILEPALAHSTVSHYAPFLESTSPVVVIAFQADA